MPLSPNFQFVAPTKEQMNLPDYAGSLARGLEAGFMPAVKSTDLLNKMMQAKYNQFKAGPEYQNAMLDFLRGQGANMWGRTANLPSERAFKDAQTKKIEQESSLANQMLEYLNNAPDERTKNSGVAGQASYDIPTQDNQEGMIFPVNDISYGNDSNQSLDPFAQINKLRQSNQNNPYGINVPVPSKQDLAMQKLFGIDTFGSKQKQAYDNIATERKAFTDKALNIDNQLESSLKYQQLLNRYNKLMDESLFTGPYGSKVNIPTAKRQEIESLTRDMGVSGISELKNAMGSARFSNLDMNIAQERKPSITWSPEARKEYTDRQKAFTKRLDEWSAFNQLASDPSLGIDSRTADRLWTAYQKHHPIVADEKTLHLNKYKPNNWARYLTPEAINSIRQTGDYNPRDKGLINNLTKDEKMISRQFSLKELERQLNKRRKESAV